jgi:predicted ATPase with chaperone activity
MSLLRRSLAATVVIAAWLFSVPAANAQGQTPSPGPSEQSQNIPDQKLDAAAAALEQVASVKESYQGRLEAAEPSDRPRLAEEAHKALNEAVTGQGLSIEEYTSIITVAQANPEVREKILQRLRPASK